MLLKSSLVIHACHLEDHRQEASLLRSLATKDRCIRKLPQTNENRLDKDERGEEEREEERAEKVAAEKVEGEEEEKVEEEEEKVEGEKGEGEMEGEEEMEKGVEVGEEVEKVAVGIKHGCYHRYLDNWGRHAHGS